MSSIFVTGANGFMAGHLIPKLISIGHSVETNMEFLMHSPERFKTVIHLAAVTNISCDFIPKLINTNIVVTAEVFSKARHIVYASSCSAAYLNNPYAYTKRYAEHLGSIHGNAVGLRFHNCYGPNNNKGIVRYLMNKEYGEKITIRGPETMRDYFHVSDCVDEIIRSIEYKPGVYDVGTGVGTETMDLVNLYQKLSGKKFDISIEEAGHHEPLRMVSNRTIPHMSLEEGLRRTIIANKS